MKTEKISKAKSIETVIDEIVGVEGTPDRNLFEVEVQIQALGTRIRQLRKSQSLTQQQFGSAIGVGKSRIAKIERGDVNITIHSVVRVFNALGFEPSIGLRRIPSRKPLVEA